MSNLILIQSRYIPFCKAVCGFTTRYGGVSEAPFDTMNLGLNTTDNQSHVLENRKRLFRAAGSCEKNATLMGQVHGTRVRVVSSGGLYEKTDGLITNSPDVFLGVLIADCIPLLVYDPENEVIGALHCGWRSIVGGIAENALSLMAGKFSTDSKNVLAVAGPSAGSCCYEIKSDVACYLGTQSVRHKDGKIYADLKTELYNRLVREGVRKTNIEQFDDCTVCNKTLYYSHRRDDNRSGRMMGFIMLKKE
ncbi:peptidoglycan editing factor PgeF [Candidatus Latescibacterota bacterium]